MDPSFNLSTYTCDLSSFHAGYSQVHGWISLLICSLGSIANILNVLVLTQREMRSPTNTILTGLAVADLLVMIDYIPYAIHLYLYRRSRSDTFSYGWAIFVLFHSNFTQIHYSPWIKLITAQICHTISISLTLILAIWRYIAVARPQKQRNWCNYRRTIFAIFMAYICCPILCIPLYITTEVKEEIEMLDSNGITVDLRNKTFIDSSSKNITLYFVRLTDTARNHHILNYLNFWIYSVVIKLLPCLVLTILSLKLLRVLLQAKKRRRKLTSVTKVDSVEKGGTRKRVEKEKQTDRTTMMLLAVLLLFLITELPQGILGLLSMLLGPGFFKTCYLKLADAIDMLTLLNSGINFILYCTMSRQFRRTFNELFCKSWKIVGNFPRQDFVDNNANTGTVQTVTQVTQV